MENHKKILGILFIISGALQLMFIFVLSIFLSSVLTWAANEVEPGGEGLINLLVELAKYLPALIVIFISVPSFIAGLGLLYKQKWAMILALIVGCLNLFSFPLGTALGVYTIWVFLEDGKKSEPAS